MRRGLRGDNIASWIFQGLAGGIDTRLQIHLMFTIFASLTAVGRETYSIK